MRTPASVSVLVILLVVAAQALAADFVLVSQGRPRAEIVLAEREAITEPVLEIVEAYISHKVMPADPSGDALHLALASFHACDFLVTWNCQHLANANKFRHIRRVNGIMGIGVPSLVTPLELLGEAEGHET